MAILKFKMEALIKLQDPDCYHTNMLYGDNKPAEQNYDVYPPTGNENLAWSMHYNAFST